MLDRQDALRPGTVLEGYRFEHILGAGGFGITYYATEELLERAVAIKEFLPNGVAHREKDGQTVRPLSSSVARDFAWGLGRFRDEARTLVAFTHPNIVPVLRYFEANGTGYLVMAFEKGQSLGQLLHPDKTLDEEEIREIAFPLLDGLKAIHARGFLHRDIKPDNIFIREDGTPVLLDFGAARQAITQRSRSLTAIVTPGYAPAEQYESSGEQGAWSDVYALGGVLYRCAVGERPLEAPARMAAHYRGRTDPMRPACQAAAGRMSPVILAAIDAALAVDGQARPQTADAFAALLRGEVAPTAATAAPRATPRAVGRPETSTIVVGESSAATRRASRRAKWPWAVAAAVVLMLMGGGYYGYAEYRARQEHAAVIKRQVDDHVAKARAAMTDGRFDEADRHLDDAGKIDSASPELATARKSLAGAREQAAAEARRRAAEAERKAKEEAARRKAEEDRRKADEAKRRAEEDAKRRAEDERRRAEEDARRKSDEDAKRRGDEAAARRAAELAEGVRQRIRDARTALGARRHLDAKRTADTARAAADLAVSAHPNSAEAAAAQREARALQEEVRSAMAQYRAALLTRARQALEAKRLDEAKRAIDEAEQLEPGADIAALRRDHAAALERSTGDDAGANSAQRLVREFLRKVNAREPENGFCSTTGWPRGSPAIYVQWLESAVVGSTKINTFKSGADCQYDRVTAVSYRAGRKCVRYVWSACQRGKNCGRGTAEACKQPGGNWDTKN